AESTLKILQRHGETHETLSCSVKLDVARCRSNEAFELFTKLCSLSQAQNWSINNAAKALEQRGKNSAIDHCINALIKDGTCTTALAEFWVDRQAAQNRWGLHARLNALKTKGEAGRRAILRYLDHLGDGVNRMRQKRDVTGPYLLRYCLWRLLRKHRDWL